MKKQYDVLVIGPVSLDHNIDCEGHERKEVGGAVVASGFAAARSGARTAVFTKLNPADADVAARFAGSGADVYWAASRQTCSIRNQYLTADKERRICTSMGVCDPFRFDELPDAEAAVYHFAGLVYGDFDGALFAEAAKRGRVAVDVQCLLRHVEPDKSMAFHDWADKRQYLPVIDYLKTDAAEAEILTASPTGRKRQSCCTAGARGKCSSPTTPRCWPTTGSASIPAPSRPGTSAAAPAGGTPPSPGTSPSASGRASPRPCNTAPPWSVLRWRPRAPSRAPVRTCWTI